MAFVVVCSVVGVISPPMVLSLVMDSVGLSTMSILSWNVQGLEDDDKCVLVRKAICDANPVIACIQETKLSAVSVFKARTFIPPRLAAFECVEADGSRGGLSRLGIRTPFPWSLLTPVASP